MFNRLLARVRQAKSKLRSSDNPSHTLQDEGNAGGESIEEKDIHQWDRPIEFLLSLISNSVGLGNVWRFPYLAAQSGGGAFLIPYFILYFLIGAPLYYLELALGMLYYNVIIAWALFYFVLSFRSRLLWSTCDNWWNTNRCFVPGESQDTFTLNGTTWNCNEAQYTNFSDYGCKPSNTSGRVTAAGEFYFRLVLSKSNSCDEFGVPEAYMTTALLVAWIIVCAAIIRGVQSSGKVAYVTAILPYIVPLVLIIFSSTLDGAGEGIKFYVVPRWELLSDLKILQAAASQAFFSLGLSFGSLMAYSSANKFKNKFFSVFISKHRRSGIVIVTCIVSFLVSLPFTCPGGIYLFDLFQEYTANVSLVLIGFFEVITVAYIYGFNRFMNDVKMMLDYRAAEYYLFVTWRFTAPVLTLVITVLNLVNTSTLTNEPSAGFARYVFPTWSVALGWIIFLVGVLPIPIFYIYSYIREYRRLPSSAIVSSIDKPRYLVALTINNTPRDDWGPKKAANQTGDYAHLCQQPVRRAASESYLTPISQKNSTGFMNPAFNRESSMVDNGSQNEHF